MLQRHTIVNRFGSGSRRGVKTIEVINEHDRDTNVGGTGKEGPGKEMFISSYKDMRLPRSDFYFRLDERADVSCSTHGGRLERWTQRDDV